MEWSNWIAITDVLITAILTAIIIFQTQKLNKKQLGFEEKNNQREAELQKRQIQVETFPYKREIYKNTFAVFECCDFLKQISEKLDWTTKTGQELSEMFSTVCEKYVPDLKATLWSLREAEYILPDNLANPILNIRELFDEMGSFFNILATMEAILTDNEMQTEFSEIKKRNISAALNNCDRILSYISFIEAELPNELRIAELNR